ncbi:HAD-IIB family hydrolase [Microbacterium sp.]|uniref:HAD-IIB family hydrolase n=1 Tax=Microbacterium sp. TaxID=51671 RepID=UPI002811459D|nr:HAD-IIB family hydrolase [Microbacterium sp.]
MTAPTLVAFDLDDTLAPSKGAISPRIAELLQTLLQRVEVAIISGGNEHQFHTQVIAQLGDVDIAALTRLHLLPTCGTRYIRHDGTGFASVYAHDLTQEEKAGALTALREEAERLGLWEAEPWGDILEDRGSQITFSALGQQAPREAKHEWDPTGSKRAALRDAVAARLPGLEVRSGGSTSIDITRAGIDKAYGMQQLTERTGIPLSSMLFYGDRLDDGGNDYPVLALGVPSIAVDGWEDTADKLDELLKVLQIASPSGDLTPSPSPSAPDSPARAAATG